MKKFGKPHQFIVFSLLSVLLIIAPLLSSSLRTPYLYIVTNLVVIALGAQAGLLSASSNPSDHDRRDGGAVSCAHKPVIPFELACDKKVVAKHDEDKKVVLVPSEKMANVIEKSLSEKIVNTVTVECVKKCPSMPSLFFIGGGDIDQGDGEVIDQDTREVEEEEEGEVGELSGQELFTKAETFIGNFYKQLKMQREDSWKKIHEFYHKAF